MDFFKHSIVKVDDFIPYALNSGMYSDDQVAQIASSIGEFDLPSWAWLMRIASWSQGMDGSRAARKLRLSELPVLKLSDLDERKRRA